MRRMILITLTLTILFAFVACAKEEETIQKPVNMYFLNKDVDYGVEDGLVRAEIQEGVHLNGDIQSLLVQYLKGPVGTQLVRAVPAGIAVDDVSVNGKTVTVTMSHDFSRINGVDLSIACVCLAMTILDFTDAEQVQLRASNASFVDSEAIIVNKNDVLFSDALISDSE